MATVCVTRVGQYGTYAHIKHHLIKPTEDRLERAIELAVDLKRRYPQCHYVIAQLGKPAWRSQFGFDPVGTFFGPLINPE